MVDGKSYRYLVKISHRFEERDQKELVLIVQEVTPKPGRVLFRRLSYYRVITPRLVAEMIPKALKRGWDPSARGIAFYVGDSIDE